MNKTVSISLGGFSFIIEENSYTRLQNYLEELRRSLEADEADEVMYDIEIRIVEIIKENLGKREVVNDDDIQKVITQIGTPEDIGKQEENYYSEQHQSNNKTKSTEKKQLFRDSKNAKLGGICAGFAHYVGMDISLMRIIWLVLLFVSGFFPVLALYVILWIVVPEAETATDFLKMKGKPMDFNSIKEESVRFANESTEKVTTFYKKNGSNIWNVVRKILAVIMAIIAIKIVLSVGIVSLGILGGVYIEDLNEIEFYVGNLSYIVVIMVGLIGSIMALIFLALSVKLFSPKTKIRYWAILVLLLLIGFIGASVYFGLEMSRNVSVYSGHNEHQENVVVSPSNGVIKLNTKKVNIPHHFQAYGFDKFSNKDKVFEKDRPDVYIIRKDNVQPHLIVKKTGKGYNVPVKMNIPLEVRNGEIFFPNYFEYSYTDRFRDYDVDYDLILPRDIQVQNIAGKEIDLDNYDDLQYHSFEKGSYLEEDINIDTNIVDTP